MATLRKQAMSKRHTATRACVFFSVLACVLIFGSREMGSRYLFTVIYVWLEKWFPLGN